MSKSILKAKYFLIIVITLFSILSSNKLRSQNPCVPDFIPFNDGESLTYKIQYHWGFIWMTAGEVTFSIENTLLDDKECFHFKGVGRTYDNYDWFFKVRDTYESWSNTETLKPYEYKRNVSEGGKDSKNHYLFNYDEGLIYADAIKNNVDSINDTLLINDCLFDVMSLVYFARSIDYAKYEINQLIPLSIILDNGLHNLSIKCLGEETIEIDNKEENVIKFSSELIEGSIFNKGDEMFIWVSNDEKRTPLKVKAEILVGSIEATLK